MGEEPSSSPCSVLYRSELEPARRPRCHVAVTQAVTLLHVPGHHAVHKHIACTSYFVTAEVRVPNAPRMHQPQHQPLSGCSQT